MAQRAAGHGHDVVGGRLLEGVDQPGGDVALAERLDGALRRAVPGVDDDGAVAGAPPLLQVGEGPVDVAAVLVDDLHRQRPGRHTVRRRR